MEHKCLKFTDKPKRNTLGRGTGGGRRSKPRLGVKAATALATLSLVASMCPGVAALTFANDQLTAGSGGLQANNEQEGATNEEVIPVDWSTHKMSTGTYRVSNDVTIIPYTGYGQLGHGIDIEPGANVTLIIDAGKTLTVRGRNAVDEWGGMKSGWHPGTAAIYLPSNSTLTIKGQGTLDVKGGDAGYGFAGGAASQSWVHHLDLGGRVGFGGQGGHGGYGAGAGIGTDGGNGGDGGSSVAYFDFYHPTNKNIYGEEGNPGSAGTAAAKAGTVNIEGAVTVIAQGGAAATGGGSGAWGTYDQLRGFEAGYSVCTSGGGGGGGGGGAAPAIGAGGSGGGGGGSGARANVDGEPAGLVADLDNLWGHGGQGGQCGQGGTSGAIGQEGANGGDDTDASRKYARAGGAGGASPAPPESENGAYTCKTDSNGIGPTVILGSYEYDGQPHGVTVGETVVKGSSSFNYSYITVQDETPGATTTATVTCEIEYLDASGKQFNSDSAPIMPGNYTARVTRTVDNEATSVEAPFTITKRQVQKPEAAALAFQCDDLQTGEGAEQSAFASLETKDYEFVADATAEDGSPSLSAASAAGSYSACFRLKDPDTCQWAGESDDAETTWVPWTISAQEFDPNGVTYWGTAYDDATTTLAYTGSPAWVRPWYTPARDAGGELPSWLGSFGSSKDSAVVVYWQADDPEGLVGYHQNSDGSLEPVTGTQVLAWKNGVDVGGTRVEVQNGDTVWYQTDGDEVSVIAVQSEKPAGADGSFTARDLSYVDLPGVMEPGTYEAIAILGDMSSFAPTALVTSTVEVTAPVKAAPAKASSSPKTGDAALLAAVSGIAAVALLAAGALVLARRRA